MDALKKNPVRIYSVVVSALALAANYIDNLPIPLILAVVAAILGVGEGVRSKVTPV
jgi:hypothetical protein